MDDAFRDTAARQGAPPGGIIERAQWHASIERLVREKGESGGPPTEEEREADIEQSRCLHETDEEPFASMHKPDTCVFCQEPEPLTALSAWVWREYFEITRNGMSGQLDRQSMDYILRENGVSEYGELQWYRSLWHEVNQILRDARKNKAGKDSDGQADSGD